jgi:hypothetical protein
MRGADMAAKQQVGPIRLQGCGEGLLVREAVGKDRKARPITGPARDIYVNQGLFRQATTYLMAA